MTQTEIEYFIKYAEFWRGLWEPEVGDIIYHKETWSVILISPGFGTENDIARVKRDSIWLTSLSQQLGLLEAHEKVNTYGFYKFNFVHVDENRWLFMHQNPERVPKCIESEGETKLLAVAEAVREVYGGKP